VVSDRKDVVLYLAMPVEGFKADQQLEINGLRDALSGVHMPSICLFVSLSRRLVVLGKIVDFRSCAWNS
jgi:hypothetical protein